jgi:hypothetical protein
MVTTRYEKRIIIEYTKPNSEKLHYYSCWAVDSDDAREQFTEDHPDCTPRMAFGPLASYIS